IVLVVLQKLQDHLALPLCRLYLFDSTSKRLSLAGRAARGRDAADGIDLFICATEIEQTGLERCREGQIVALPPVGAGGGPLADRFRDAGFEAALAVPLIVENGLFGILMTARNEANSCSPEEADFLKIVAEQVGLAAHQAKLHAQLQGAYDELRQTQVAVMQQE